MACSSCRNRSTSRSRIRPSTAATAIDFTTRIPTANRITGGDGKIYLLARPLVKNKPKGGNWALDVIVGTQKFRVHKPTSSGMFAEIKRLYRLNDIEIDDNTIWFNLNLEWTKGHIQRHVHVTESDLRTLIKK